MGPKELPVVAPEPAEGADPVPELGVPEHKVDLVMDAAYYDKYRKIEQKQWDEWRAKMGDTGNLEVFLNGLRQAINGLDGGEGAKIKWVLNKVSTLRPLDKVIIFSNWITNGIKLVQHELKARGIRFTKVTGTRTKEQRQKSVQLFNSGKKKVLFLPRAGGEGLDIKGATHVVLMEPSWHDAAEHQVIGRAIRYESHAHLPAQYRHVDVWRLIMRKPTERLPGDTKWDSVDVRVRDLLLKKKDVNDKAMGLVKEYRVRLGGRGR
jgi:SNF2 family DNA or RNA helicase